MSRGIRGNKRLVFNWWRIDSARLVSSIFFVQNLGGLISSLYWSVIVSTKAPCVRGSRKRESRLLFFLPSFLSHSSRYNVIQQHWMEHSRESTRKGGKGGHSGFRDYNARYISKLACDVVLSWMETYVLITLNNINSFSKTVCHTVKP